MYGNFMPPFTPCHRHVLDTLLFLQVIPQETVLHQLIYLVSQRQTVAYGVTERLVELTPGILVGPELLVGHGGYLQPLCYVGDSDEIL